MQRTSGRTRTNSPTSLPKSSQAPPMAHELMAPFNAYSRGWGKRFGHITKDEEIDGLGDEAWLLRTESDGIEVTYHWRRGNLVFEAHLHCFGYCPRDVCSPRGQGPTPVWPGGSLRRSEPSRAWVKAPGCLL